MVDVLRELVTNRLADLYVRLADKIVGGGKSLEVRNCLKVPYDDSRFHEDRRPLASGDSYVETFARRRALATSAFSTSTISRNSLDNWLDNLSQNISARLS